MSDPRFSLKAFMLNVVLWLPLAFFLWFYLASVLVLPVQLGLAGLLEVLLGDALDGVGRQVYQLEVGIILALPEGRAVVEIPVNPMIYGYGLPLVAGLIVSTPVSALRRLVQLAATFLAVVAVELWGSFWETFRTLAFNLGEPGAALVAELGIGREVIALCYQFGYLVLPAVLPITLWILMNRIFIEGIVQHRIEPEQPVEGQ